MTATKFLVINPIVSADTVRSVLCDERLKRVDTLVGDGVHLSSEEVWATDDHLLAVNIADDPLVVCQYLALRGAERESLAKRLTSKLSLITPEEGLARASTDASESELIRAIYQLVVLFPDFDAQAFVVLSKRASSDPSEKVREVTVDALAYRAWPESVPLLRRISNSDPAVAVRQRAKEVLAHLQSVT